MSLPKDFYKVKKSINTHIEIFFRLRIKTLRKQEPALVPIYEALEEFCLRGGKRLRGYLVILGYKIAGKKPTKALLDIACGIELYHSALLIHDDIIDNDAERRGKPSFHVLFNRKIAREAGNILISLASEMILASRFPDDVKIRCAKITSFGATSTAIGELMDILYSYKTVPQKIVQKILHLKTARYSVSEPLVVGYVLGGGRKYERALYEAGESLGVAFQLKDDLLGLTGNKLYQNRGSDIREVKPFVLAPKIAHLSDQKRKFIQYFIKKKNATNGDLESLRKLITETKLPQYASHITIRYADRAQKQFAFVASKKVKVELSQIIDFVVNREE